MEYLELTTEEALAGITDNPETIFKPILEELYYYKDNSSTIEVSWGGIEVSVNDGVVYLGGYPVHPFLHWRLLNAIAGIGRSRRKFWEANPSIVAELFREGLKGFGDRGRIVICRGEVVATNFVATDFYDHVDFLEPMMKQVAISVKTQGSYCTLTGVQSNPIWPFVRILILGGKSRNYYTGYQLEANFLFRKGLTRASMSHYLRSFKHDIDMDLSNVWSVKAPLIRGTTKDVLAGFRKNMKTSRNKGGLAIHMNRTQNTVRNLAEKEALVPWQQASLVKLQSQGVSRYTLRETAATFRRGSQLDFVLTMLKATREFNLDRQIVFDKNMTKFLLGEK